MNGVPGLRLPSYFRYYTSPVKLVEAPGGGLMAWRVSIDTGGWESADDLIEEILFAVGGEVSTLSAADFVQEVERYRARYLDGEGPIFALYETVKAITDVERRERRYLTPRERAIVNGVRRQTFVMFEEQLQQQGDPGADPSIGQE
ncbi:hypothetical protein [Micromonospora inyonensis]|uniref:Uncharacterized protein n=1 Tax=Micromonospora inyonensis TaxID=47866 RepID=A0A1C6RQ24_9ACTN|nr:hypothetical protein [Micromonospora inyonensis]SCL19260.1 hypothetical protein GA0074694_2625 [Micromonospora inyonensis]